MAGVKGRSGRKTNRDEAMMHGVIDLSWRLAKADLENPELDMAIKREIYTKIIVKSMPTEFSGSISANITAMGTIEKSLGGVAVESMNFNIGSVPDGQADTPQDTEPS